MHQRCTSILILLLLHQVTMAQFTNWHWTFGDGCGIRFDTAGIDSFYTSSVNSRGTCVSIADSNGNLLFYASSPNDSVYLAAVTNTFGVVYRPDHSIMPNGLNLMSTLWYREMVIVPDPGNAQRFYLFTAGVSLNSNPGLRYSVVDLSHNNGLGAVVNKNTLLDPLPINDGLISIRHGNGRDWWLVYKTMNIANDTIYTYLITPNGLSTRYFQKIGSFGQSGFYRTAFNAEGNLMAACSYRGVVELFDFDRCTGLFSNHRILRQSPSSPPTDEKDWFWSLEFSANGRFLYVNSVDVNSYLFQFDLLNPDPYLSKVMIDSFSTPTNGGSYLKRGPDQRIYRATAWFNGVTFNYPYPDTAWNIYNTHLSVIEHPDSLGFACDYQAWSIFLPNCRTYYGLPNNPDYTMGALAGSPCDTLTTGIAENTTQAPELWVYPNPSSGTFRFRLNGASLLPQAVYELFNAQGAIVATGRMQQMEQSVEMRNRPPGIYLLRVQSGSKVFLRKVLKE